MLQGGPPTSLLQQDPGAVQEPHREHSLFSPPWQHPFPRADLRVAPAGAGLRPKGAEGEGPRRHPHLACREALFLQLKCAGQTVSHQSASGRGHTTPDLVTPLLSFQHTRFKHEPGLLLGRHRAEKSRSRGKIILNSRAHLKPIHIISPTILSLIYEEN